MKTKVKNICLLGIAFLMLHLGFSSCDDANDDVVRDVVYLANARNIDKSEQLTVDVGGRTVSVAVRTDRPVKSDLDVTLDINEDYLTEYNKRNGTGYLLLPETYYTFSDTHANIEAGRESAAPTNIHLEPLSDEMNKSGMTYALPVGISSADGYAILESASNYIFAIMPIPMADVPMFQRGNTMILAMQNDLVVNRYTVEMLFKISQLGEGVGQMNNQIIFTAGGGQKIFMRFGDTGLPGTTLNAVTMGSRLNSKTQFKADKWYHVALTNDGTNVILYVNGVEDARMSSPGTTITMLKGDFHFCGEKANDGYMRSKMWGSQLRIWTVARTADQIRNSMYGVDPETPGLEAYWKMNEGAGNTFADATGHGHNAYGEEASVATQWFLNERVEVGR
ncbi:DUF1735 and LamG domain-containing protein [Dysgonomonas sp. 25]|uniref:DUF1735 and LamG domain-containing protein n=1 Tax=Dysgonomonas sp. 25 TaxID=2302933 RepID=UPI0013D375DF|nr:DUF1735 and LamG domain-containing protein [Dysgonomonas sp. 25]NDV68841.1 DUF1735 domain-containing protein [Dysgonomonas sp. 25]